MLLQGLLSSGFEFEPQEMLIKFKFKLLNSCLLVAVVFAFLVGLLHSLGFHDTGDFHSWVNYCYSIISIGLMIWLRQSRDNYDNVSLSLIIVSFLTFTSALIFVQEDQFRIIWFYIVVFIAYTVKSNKAGVITTLASIGMIVLCFLIFELGISKTTLQGSLIGLIISSFLASIHVRKIAEFEAALLNKNRELEVLATIDGLTGVMNKRMFNEMMAKYLEAAHRNKKPLAFLYLDLDHFKQVNDQHGHQVGDIMLIKFTDVVGKCLRKSDLLGRVGGEEFSAVLYETDLEAASIVAEKIRQQVEQSSYTYDGKQVTMSVSIGIAQLDSEFDTVESIQLQADQALYKAKHNGRNRVELANGPAMSQLSMFKE